MLQKQLCILSDFMSEVSSSYWVTLAKVFVILIILPLMISCANHSPAPVLERSKTHVYRPKTHVVIAGDTLFSIAWRYGLKYEALAKLNGISPPYIIRPSQVIRLDLAASNSTSAAINTSSRSNVVVSLFCKVIFFSPLYQFLFNRLAFYKSSSSLKLYP